MGALASGTAAAVGSGAFTSGSLNNRNVKIPVTTDQWGLLAVRAGPGPNGEYVTQTDSGIEIDITNAMGSGVNPEAEFEIDNLFHIVNQGTQEVDVFIVDHTDGKDDADQQAVKYYRGDDPSTSVEGPGHSVTLGPGDKLNVGLYLDSSGLENGDSMRNRTSVVAAEN